MYVCVCVFVQILCVHTCFCHRSFELLTDVLKVGSRITVKLHSMVSYRFEANPYYCSHGITFGREVGLSIDLSETTAQVIIDVNSIVNGRDVTKTGDNRC